RVIDPQVALILVIGFWRRAAVVVRRSGRCRQRIMREQRQGDGIDRAGGDRVARKRRSNRAGGRIEDRRNLASGRFGKEPLLLKPRRYSRNDVSRDGLPLPLVVGEEERPIALDRTAGRSAELAPPVFRFWTGRLKEVARVQVLVAQELERVSRKGVRARAGRQ